jgi:hypothetical protein
VKLLFSSGALIFAALLVYFIYGETAFTSRGSWTRTTQTPEYIHERYQRSYFSASDAAALRKLHNQEGLALAGLVSCSVVTAVLLKKSRD